MRNEAYYNILEKCTIEAFDCIESIDLYPKDGTKAIWDVSTLTITKSDELLTDADNEVFRKHYIQDNMRVTFLMALDRHWKDFEIKYSITRSFFYKKCYQSLLFKTSQSSLWYKPDFGFDFNEEPCVLTFVWSMRNDIESRSEESKQTEPEPLAPEPTSSPFKKNNFDQVPPKKVYAYFRKELLDTGYLSSEELEKYLIMAFQDENKVPVERFTFAKKIKVKDARDIFYRYYTVTAKAGNDNKMVYAELLGNYFTGFTAKKVFDNFAK